MNIEYEFYEHESIVLIRFDAKNNVITVKTTSFEEPWFVGSSYTNQYSFIEPNIIGKIISECGEIESHRDLEDLLKRHPHEYEQIAVDV